MDIGNLSLEVFTNLRSGKITVNEATTDMDRRIQQLLDAK